MTTSPSTVQGPLTIGELSRRTGVNPATLRMWEQRHGFPVPDRRDSGHRRYPEPVIGQVLEVVRRRDEGMRLEVAIAAVAAAGQLAVPPGPPSVYATVRERHAWLQPQRLTKSTLLAMSWAIEDECAARAERPALFGAFQSEKYWRGSRSRWRELARVARVTMAFADFGDSPVPTDPSSGVVLVHLPEDAPMRREWAVVCDAPGLSAMLTAWELPGQSAVRDRDRIFEALWSVEPSVVRDAARACAQVAAGLGHEEAAPVLYGLADDAPPADPALRRASALLGRVVGYVDSAR